MGDLQDPQASVSNLTPPACPLDSSAPHVTKRAVRAQACRPGHDGLSLGSRVSGRSHAKVRLARMNLP